MAQKTKLYTGPFEFHYGGIQSEDLRLEAFDMAALKEAAELVKDLRMTHICKDGVDKCLQLVESGRTYETLTQAEKTTAWLLLAAVSRHVKDINDEVRQQAT